MPEDLVCGLIDPPPALAETKTNMRFIYYPQQRTGQIEQNEAWIIANEAGKALVAQNRVLFDQLWEQVCASGQPFRETIRMSTGL